MYHVEFVSIAKLANTICAKKYVSLQIHQMMVHLLDMLLMMPIFVISKLLI